MTAPDHLAPARHPPRARVALVVAVALTIAACSGLLGPQDWDPNRGPVVPHDSFPADCTLCHVGSGWHDIRPDFTFDHAAVTGVPLTGAHDGAECLRCHNDRGPVAQFAARGCAGCHIDPHRGKLGGTCDVCHGESDWQPTGAIAAHSRTRFPLVGAHAAAACWRCHPGAQTGNFEGLDPSCARCHTGELRRATSPDHAAQGWTDHCERCHLPVAWRPARFDHPASVPLRGGHAGLACRTCHVNEPDYQGLSPDCIACHRDDYVAVTDPDHQASGFGQDCTLCHTLNGWQGAVFRHGFPIDRGAHRGLACNECHTTGGAAFSCIDCHEHAQSDMASKHREVRNYSWSSPACLDCHPAGRH
ncbi:MAG: hypothetical protein IPM29_12845 [Planctomycetes bacterium]|nr:hypothetical protein [Planctomycetota bacterium]